MTYLQLTFSPQINGTVRFPPCPAPPRAAPRPGAASRARRRRTWRRRQGGMRYRGRALRLVLKECVIIVANNGDDGLSGGDEWWSIVNGLIGVNNGDRWWFTLIAMIFIIYIYTFYLFIYLFMNSLYNGHCVAHRCIYCTYCVYIYIAIQPNWYCYSSCILLATCWAAVPSDKLELRGIVGIVYNMRVSWLPKIATPYAGKIEPSWSRWTEDLKL